MKIKLLAIAGAGWDQPAVRTTFPHPLGRRHRGARFASCAAHCRDCCIAACVLHLVLIVRFLGLQGGAVPQARRWPACGLARKSRDVSYPRHHRQWMNCGPSGVEHAEGGGDDRGTPLEGFQIWINMPAKNKMDAPSYGTESPDAIPQLDIGSGPGSAKIRVLAGPFADRRRWVRSKRWCQPR
eukprot:3435889-Rhodomonas_salina.1